MFTVGDTVRPNNILPVVADGKYTVLAIHWPPNVCAACGENWNNGRSSDCIFYCSAVANESDNQMRISIADESGAVLMSKPRQQRGRHRKQKMTEPEIIFFASSHFVRE